MGAEFTCALTTDGHIACWGDNTYHIVDDAPAEAGFIQIAAGAAHVCALNFKGVPVCWGDGVQGQLNSPPESDFKAIVSGTFHSCALGAAGTITCWGSLGSNRPPVGGGFTKLFGGPNGSCALNANTEIVCWGRNEFGDLNGIPGKPGFNQIVMGLHHGCALSPIGTIACWGNGGAGQLTGIPTEAGFIEISSTGNHTCGLRGDRSVVCWGDNSMNQLADVPSVEGGYTHVSAGMDHTCALTALDSSIRCWGSPSEGGFSRIPGTTFLPAADLSVPTSVPEGTDIVMSFSNPRVPGYERPATFTYSFTCGNGTGFTQFDVGPAHNCSTTDNTTRTLKGIVKDNDGETAEYLVSVDVENVAPILGPIVDESPDAAKADVLLKCGPTDIKVVKISSFTDPGSGDTWIGTADWGDGTGASQFRSFTAPGEFGFGNCFAQPGHYTVTLTIADDDGGSDTKTFDITLSNTGTGTNVQVTPVDATTGAPSPVQLTFGNVSGGGTTTVSSQPVGGGGGPPPPSNFRFGSPPTYYNIQTTASYDGTITVCLSYAGVRYGNESQLKLLHGETAANGSVKWVDVTTSLDVVNDVICGSVTTLSPFLAAELNLAPVVSAVRLPSAPIPVGAIASVTAPFSDANPGDFHTASIDWEDQTLGAAVSESGGSGMVSGSRAYSQPGVYTVRVNVSDGSLPGNRSSANDVPAYIVVYDPSAGFVTGGGWISSPAGAFYADPAIVGKASFGFVSKYRSGANAPDGNTEFQFDAGNLQFKSTSYDWLVVAGSRAQFKGDGTINGAGSFRFFLTAIDGESGSNADKFRIKISNKITGAMIYDNQKGAAEDSDAATTLGSGSIIVHKN